MTRRFAALPALLATLAAANSGAATVLPDGTYRYETSIAGRPVGGSTIVIRRKGDAIEIGESASLMGQGLVSEREIVESTFATTRYVASSGGKELAVTIDGSVAILSSGGQSAKIEAAAGAPFLVSDNMVAGFAQIPAMLHVTGTKKLTFACICGQYLALPIAVTAQSDGVATILVQGQTGTLRFDPLTFVLARFDLPAQQLSIVLRGSDAVPTALPSPAVATPLPLPSARYAARDVTVRADDGVTLAATLTGPEASATPAAGLVFVHGSGCNDRDETIGPNKIFAQLANRLSNDGYAVLRYDKRSCGRSGGSFPVRSRLIADALAAVAFLRRQPGVDPKRIFVLGHSEGGELAPSVAIADGKLRGIVLLAPPALPLEQLLLQQLLRNSPSAERAAQERIVRAELDAIAAGKKSGAGNAWLRSSFGIDPAALIARVPCPILIVQGTKDIQVLPADTPRLVNAARAAHRTVTVVMLDNDDHLFIGLDPAAASTGAEYFTPAYLDPRLFEAIESWLNVHA